MSSYIYDKARKSFCDGDFVLLTDNIKAVLVDTGTYTPSSSADQYLSDIAAGARIATSGNLSGKSTTGGVFDADDVTFSAVTGASVEAVVLYKDTGVAGTSRLIAYIDSVTGFPFTPSGADVTIVWDSGANKIFKL
jgi:hypothetical protein